MTGETARPVDIVLDALAERVRKDASGAMSLSHVLAVVPTAQSGRRLRLALAKRFPGGVLPPVVCEASRLLEPPDTVDVAGRSDETAAFFEALGEDASIDVAAQLSDIRRVLGSGALFFSDVASSVAEKLKGEAAAAEEERWRALAEIEERYFKVLERRGKTDRIAALKKTLSSPVAPAGVEEIFLACLYDPPPVFSRYVGSLGLKVTEVSLPSPPLGPFRVLPCATGAAQAAEVAAIFASVPPDEELPSLCIADADSFAEIEGALKANGLKVHDPSGVSLAESSLGHLTAQTASLSQTRSYAVFSAFIRGGDVRRWICDELGISSEDYTASLVALDNAQAKLLPETIDQIGPKTKGPLRAIFEFIDVKLRKCGLREILRSVFKGRLLDANDSDSREFAAAAEALSSLIDECSATGLSGRPAHELFMRRLREQKYSLEPDEGDIVLVDGWLELPFVTSGEIVIAGFNEGCIPESIVAHPFLPDALRRAFGLQDNEGRLSRDRRILSAVCACRAKGAVTALFRAIDSGGDTLKPSKLLFEGLDDATLLSRVRRFYSSSSGTAFSPRPDLPDGWKIDPGIPAGHETLEFTSPSSLDLYLRCPFTYRLKKTFGERTDDRARELDPSEFGNLVHDALERWGSGPLADSSDAAAISDELSMHVDSLLAERFGSDVPAIVDLQAESAKRRLGAFASIQAKRRAEGWRLAAVELRMNVRYGHTEVKGRCDRIDRHDETGEWCVIDYKTFDNASRAEVVGKNGEWKSLQLPLYCAMLDASEAFPEAKRENISSAYCVLGKTDADTFFSEPVSGAFVPEAESKVKEIIDSVERGIFWPPSPTKEWQWDYSDWLTDSPADSVNPEWIADQERRIEAKEKDKERT